MKHGEIFIAWALIFSLLAACALSNNTPTDEDSPPASEETGELVPTPIDATPTNPLFLSSRAIMNSHLSSQASIFFNPRIFLSHNPAFRSAIRYSGRVSSASQTATPISQMAILRRD